MNLLQKFMNSYVTIWSRSKNVERKEKTWQDKDNKKTSRWCGASGAWKVTEVWTLKYCEVGDLVYT